MYWVVVAWMQQTEGRPKRHILAMLTSVAILEDRKTKFRIQISGDRCNCNVETIFQAM